MPSWLRRLFTPRRRSSPPDPRAAADPPPPEDGRRWWTGLAAQWARAPHAFREELPRLRELLADWYAQHPLEVAWGRDYRFAVIDPLGITADDVVRDDDVLELAPWATLLRSLIVSGDTAFHHGCNVADLVALLRDPSAPAALVNLSLPWLVVEAASDVDALVEVLCTSERLRGLEHLQLDASLSLGVRHFERLAEAPWAASLRTLDLTEAMVDWSVDVAPEERHAALRALGKLQSLTHLFMYNDFGEVDDLAVFLEATFPALTHLNLGAAPNDPELLALLARTSSLPRLEELCLASGPNRTCSQWDLLLEVPFAVYLHGQRVTATYPKREP